MPRKPTGGQVGRPSLTPDGTTVRKNVVLTPEQAAFLGSQPGGVSASVRRLVEREMTMPELPVAFCTQRSPDALATAKDRFGEDVALGYPGSHDTGPYSPDEWEVVGYVGAHRSGPLAPVVRRKA